MVVKTEEKDMMVAMMVYLNPSPTLLLFYLVVVAFLKMGWQGFSLLVAHRFWTNT